MQKNAKERFGPVGERASSSLGQNKTAKLQPNNVQALTNETKI
jgi:hypothetical protein